MKPDWKDAPEWAKYLVRDQNGRWTWYERGPTPFNGGWHAFGRFMVAVGPDHDWRKSMEERPNEG